MMDIERYLKNAILDDALQSHKMAFVSGPRQVGKTSLCQSFLKSRQNYFNWDEVEFQRIWIKSPMQILDQVGDGPVVFDELHKHRKWKSNIKGLYDRHGKDVPIVVTGSARMDVYRRGGDSLLGRYFPYRLHPFSVSETSKSQPCADVLEPRKIRYPLDGILQLSGFPDPLLAGSAAKAKRWSRLRLERIIKEDVRDLKNISDLQAIHLLAKLLPDRVGSPLSINSLREDLQVAYATLRDWMSVLENLYVTFKVLPYSKKIARSLTVESKYYLYDPIEIMEHGARLENVVALHLLKSCDYWTDTAEGFYELRYIRTRDKQEVDFCVLRGGKPWMLVECKSGVASVSPTLTKMNELLKPKFCIQLTAANENRLIRSSGVRVMNTEMFLSCLV